MSGRRLPTDRQKTTGRALLFGLLAALLAKFATSVIMSAATRGVLAARGFDEAQIRAFFAGQFDSPWLGLLGLVPELVAGIVGGYVAAARAPRLPYWHALGAVVAAALVGLAPVLGQLPGLMLAGALSVALGAGYVGAVIHSLFPLSRH